MYQWQECIESLFDEDQEGSEQTDLKMSQENEKGINEEIRKQLVSRLKGGKHQEPVALCWKC